MNIQTKNIATCKLFFEYTDKKYSYLQAFFTKKDRGDTK